MDGQRIIPAHQRQHYAILEKQGQAVSLSLVVPVNTQATVFLPANGFATILEGGRPLTSSVIMQVNERRMDTIAYEVGFGTYQFITQ